MIMNGVSIRTVVTGFVNVRLQFAPEKIDLRKCIKVKQQPDENKLKIYNSVSPQRFFRGERFGARYKKASNGLKGGI